MPARRTHTKSRTGCTNCKRRKIKCDEVRPVCFHCKRHELPCSLSTSKGNDEELSAPSRRLGDSHLHSNLVLSTPGSIESDAATPPGKFMSVRDPRPSDNIAPFPPQELWTRDFELLHHYCTFTADTLSIRRDMAHVWRIAIPQQGYRYSWVMHGLLAVSATHKAYLIPDKRRTYLPLADYHQTLGLEGYRSALQDFEHDTERWLPLFAFATVVVLHELTIPVRMETGRLEDPIRNMLGLTSLIGGIRTTLTPVLSHALRTEFAPLFYGIWPMDLDTPMDFHPPLDNTCLPLDTWDALSRLSAFHEADLPSNSLQHYHNAVKHFEVATRLFTIAGMFAELGAVLSWLYDVHESILVDLNSRHPHALLLYSYLMVYFSAVENHFWYIRGWTHVFLEEVEKGLAGQPKFLELFQWPRAKILSMGNRYL